MHFDPATRDDLIYDLTNAITHLFADEKGKLPIGGMWLFCFQGGAASAPFLMSNIIPEELPGYVERAVVAMADEEAVFDAEFSRRSSGNRRRPRRPAGGAPE
jgi:hypothetical protein